MSDPSHPEGTALPPALPPLFLHGSLLALSGPVLNRSSLSYSGKAQQSKAPLPIPPLASAPQANFKTASPVAASLASSSSLLYSELCSVLPEWLLPPPVFSETQDLPVLTPLKFSLQGPPPSPVCMSLLLLVFFSRPWALLLGICTGLSSLTRSEGLPRAVPSCSICSSWWCHLTQGSAGHLHGLRILRFYP